MTKKFTHIGIIEGRDKQYKVYLRETKCFWIDSGNGKYRKATGYSTETWPRYSLILDSIKEENNEIKVR